MKKFGLLMMMLMMSIAIFAKSDLKTVVYTTTPQMHCENCENKIKGNLKFVKGIKKIETSVEKQTVTITYDANKTTPEKIEEGFKKIGYAVEKIGVPAMKIQCAEKMEGCKMGGCSGEGCQMKEGEKMDCCKENKEATEEGCSKCKKAVEEQCDKCKQQSK